MGNRKLAHSEKTFHVFSSERSRDKANAQRQINGLNIADMQLENLQYLAHRMPELINAQRETNRILVDQVNAQLETNRLLAIIADRLNG